MMAERYVAEGIVAFPVSQSQRMNAQYFGSLPLEQFLVQPALSDVVVA